jgi:hypothetical protein
MVEIKILFCILMNMRSFRQAKNPALPSSIFSNKSGSCPGKASRGIHFPSLIHSIIHSILPCRNPHDPGHEKNPLEEKDLTTEGTENTEKNTGRLE